MVVPTIFFVPHQDDELITMGVAIARSANNEGAICVLLTDGRNCESRKTLGDGGSCVLIGDAHSHELSKDDFSHARDAEFRLSCLALGVPEECIFLPDNRAIDGSLSVEQAKIIISSFAALFPGSKLCTHNPIRMPHDGSARLVSSKNAALKKAAEQQIEQMPFGVGADHELEHEFFDGSQWRFSPQHNDHASSGVAVIELLKEGLAIDVELFVEPYNLIQYVEARDSREALVCSPLSTIVASPDEYEKLASAIDQYKLWDPASGRYACGYHSVAKELATVERRPFNYCIKASA